MTILSILFCVVGVVLVAWIIVDELNAIKKRKAEFAELVKRSGPQEEMLARVERSHAEWLQREEESKS